MLLTQLLTPLLLFSTSLTTALSIPQDATSLSLHVSRDTDIFHGLEKRKGGGGHGSSGGRTGSGSSSGSSSSGSTGSSSSSGRTSSSSNSGGRSTSGTGVKPTYGGSSYAGGARVPYSAGARSPLGIAPYFLIGGGLGFWAYNSHPYGAYEYRFPANVTFYNQTSGRNESLPALCMCNRYQECGCDSNTDGTYIGSLVGDGSPATLAKQRDVVQLDVVNGTQTLVVNGTLANGTTASGGTDDTGAAGGRSSMLSKAGWGVMAAGIACAFTMV